MRDRVTLGSLCYPASSQINLADETMIDYIDISSVNNASKCITGYQSFPFSESPSRARKSVRKNSIIISTVRPNLNAVALFEIETPNVPVVSTGFCVLDCKQDVDIRFVFNFCKSKSFVDQMVTQATGASYPAVSDKIIRSAILPSYSYEEQYLIGNTLESISCIINSRKKQLQQLDDLIKARFVEMFEGDFPQTTANISCEAIVDCPHATPKYIGNELICPAIRTSEIKNGFIDWTSMKYVSREECRERNKRLTPKRGDIVYAREGTYGDCVILPDGYDFCLGQRTMLFRPNYELITSEYLHQALRSDNVKRQADISNAGSTVPHVNVADAKEFSFPLPPLELQNQFASFVNQVDKSKSVVQKALDEAQLLFDSLMQQYFG